MNELIKVGDIGMLRKELGEIVANHFNISQRTAGNKMNFLLDKGPITSDGKKRNMRLFCDQPRSSLRKRNVDREEKPSW